MNTTTFVRRAAARWRTWRTRPRMARVTGIYCPTCQQWRHPRHFTPTAATCRTCTNS